MTMRLEDVQAAATAWARETFPHATLRSIATHLLKEIHELEREPDDVEEMADVALLLGHLNAHVKEYAQRRGVDLARACAAKLAINRTRQWGTVNAEGFVEHIREDES